MRVVFMGTPDFAVQSLEELHKADVDIVAVVTGRDKRRGRGTQLSPTPVKMTAEKIGIPVIESDNLRDSQLAENLRALNPDLFIVVAFRVLPPDLLKIPSIGSINLHGSLLPRYRGAAPIHRAIMNGEVETGVTVFFLDERVDTGNILMQEAISIGPDETTGSVYERLMHIGAKVLVKAVKQIATSDYNLLPQNDLLATPAPKIFAEDCLIDFSRPAQDVHNLIRGLSPFPAAYTWLDGKRFKVLASRMGPIKSDAEPNRIYFENDQLMVPCAENITVILDRVQLEGKSAVDGSAFARGYNGEGNITGPG